MDKTNLHTLVFPVGRITTTGVELLGTCFIINRPGLFVTATHVTNNDDNNLVIVFANALYTDPAGINSYQDTSNTEVKYLNVKIYRTDPIHDICILKANEQVSSNLQIISTDVIGVSDEVCVVGYPHCNMGRMVLTYQETLVGAKILLQTAGIKSKHIVLNIQTRPGQSGSPVFRKSDSKLVAIIIGSYAPQNRGGISLAGVDPLTLHQTTHAISAEYILKLLQ